MAVEMVHRAWGAPVLVFAMTVGVRHCWRRRTPVGTVPVHCGDLEPSPVADSLPQTTAWGAQPAVISWRTGGRPTLDPFG